MTQNKYLGPPYSRTKIFATRVLYEADDAHRPGLHSFAAVPGTGRRTDEQTDTVMRFRFNTLTAYTICEKNVVVDDKLFWPAECQVTSKKPSKTDITKVYPPVFVILHWLTRKAMLSACTKLVLLQNDTDVCVVSRRAIARCRLWQAIRNGPRCVDFRWYNPQPVRSFDN